MTMEAEKQRRQYPVLGALGEKQQEYIPWDILAPHEARALRNHGQTLEQLAARGGLGWVEIVWILLDKRWGGPPNPSTDVARSAVLKYVAAWEAEQEKGDE